MNYINKEKIFFRRSKNVQKTYGFVSAIVFSVK